MKKFSKPQLLLLVLLFTIGAFVRLYNFDLRMTFGPEQAISLINSAEKIDHFTLLGMPYLQRQTSTGFNLWHSPIFPYSLMPLQIIFDYDPYPITLYFVFLNLFTAFTLFLVAHNLTKNFFLALFATFFFLFDPYMIHHSLFVWIVNYFPLVSIITGFFVLKMLLKYQPWHPLVLGLLSGIGIGLDLAYITIFPFIFVLLLIPKNKIRNIIYFIIGGIIANLPTLIFDLRHDFFHLRIFYQFFLDYRSGLVSPLITYYHFLHFFPFYFVFLALIFTLFVSLTKKPYFLSLLTIVLYLFFLTKSPYWNLNQSIGMPKGITYLTYQESAQAIAKDNPNAPFNIATLHDFDTRAHPLRYLVQYVQKKSPESVTAYQGLKTLYVLVPQEYDLNNPQVWELQVHQPYQVIPLAEYKDYHLVKLSK